MATTGNNDLRVLVAGLHNSTKHQVVRQIQAHDVNVQHINGDIRKSLPQFDIAVVLVCGVSHQLFQDIRHAAKRENKPLLVTGAGFASIKEKFTTLIQEHKEKTMNMGTSAIRIFLQKSPSKKLGIKYVLYYICEAGKELFNSDLRDALKFNYPESTEESHHFSNFIRDYCGEGDKLLVRVGSSSGLPRQQKMRFNKVSVDDLAEFEAAGFSVELLRRRHSDLLDQYLRRKSRLGALVGDEETPAVISSPAPVVEAAAAVQIPPPPVPVPEPIAHEAEIARPDWHFGPRTQSCPQASHPASSIDFGAVLKDVRATAELLLERVAAIENLLAREIQADDEDKTLADKARALLDKVPQLADYNDSQLERLHKITQLMGV